MKELKKKPLFVYEMANTGDRGFWQPLDTLRDKQQLDALWNSGSAPWKTWR